MLGYLGARALRNKKRSVIRYFRRAFCASLPPVQIVGFGRADAADESLKLRIVIASPMNTFAAPNLVAKDLGWFTKAAFETEDIIVTGIIGIGLTALCTAIERRRARWRVSGRERF